MPSRRASRVAGAALIAADSSLSILMTFAAILIIERVVGLRSLRFG